MIVNVHASPLTAHEALPLKHAALGAARKAGDTELGAGLMDFARHYNRVVRRSKRPALSIPGPGELSTVRASDVSLFTKVMARELASMGGLAEWRIIGVVESEGETFRPLLARKVGNSVRYKKGPTQQKQAGH